MEYKGIKIYDKVIIVERTCVTEGGYNWRGRTVNQGYVVDINNKKMLETATNWAKWTKYPDSDEFFGKGNHYWSDGVTKEQKEAYDAAKVDMPGIIHEYENGNFEITLDEAAGGSSQGGKLSFWNCVIKAPDGKVFLVGINSELLLHLMMATTLEKGTCKEKVWLGRIGGTQVGVFTPEMEDFKQAKLDEAQRQATKQASSKYIPGDIVKTLYEKDLYLGTVYQYYDFESSWRYRDNYIIIYDKPKPVQVYRSIYIPWNSTEEKLSDYYNIKNTKVKRLVDSHIELDETALEFIRKYDAKKLEDYLKQDKEHGSRYAWDSIKSAKKYGDGSKLSREDIIKYLENEYKNYCSKWGYSLYSEYKVISEAEWEKIKN